MKINTSYLVLGLFFISFILIIVYVQQESKQINQNDNKEQLSNEIPLSISNKGLSNLCSGEEECIDFCLNNKGRCEAYCKENYENKLCKKIFPVMPEATSNISDTTEIINGSLNEREIAKENKPPVLKNLGINIEPWNKQTNLAGDLIFTKKILFEDDNVMNRWVFVEFGVQGQKKNDPSKNIEYWFHVPLGTKLRAPIDGVVHVGFIEHTKDWGINIAPSANSNWLVSFEHMTNLIVKEGDIVKAGDIVGEAAPRSSYNYEIAMTELAVWIGENGIIKYCPFEFLEESLKPRYEEKINRLAKDWEEFIGKDVYKQEDWVAPGCLLHNITER